jgi:3-isopropylmalate/(R)-2-methylmalate dehydratase small subunit
MNEIRHVVGRGVPVRGNDIDTDRIIPARFLRCVTFDGLGEHAFADDRAGLREQGKQHPFDDPRFSGAAILVGNSNFGCGSSREHAPQSLLKWGIQALVAVSFAEIFYNNNIALGVPCVQVTAAEARTLQDAIAADPSLELRLDIETKTLYFGNDSLAVTLPDGVQNRFLSGHWDATGQLLDNRAQVEAVASALPYLNDWQ